MQEDKPNDSALELRLKQSNRYITLGLLAVLLLSVLGFIYLISVKESESVAQSNQQVQSKVIIDSEVCKVYPEQELCTLARTITANPKEAIIPKDGLNGKDGSNGTNGANGSNGVDGRAVSKFDQSTGSLIVTYSDGQTQDLGRITGKDGIDGAVGATGAAGAAGRGIIFTSIEAGNLLVSYNDGTTQNVGIVVGPKGEKGDTGQTGDTGPAGVSGSGLTPKSIDTDVLGYVTITYSDNTTSKAGRVILPTLETLTCTNGVLTIKLSNGPAQTVAVDCTPDNIPGLTGNK